MLEAASWAGPGPWAAVGDEQRRPCPGGARRSRLGSRQLEANGTETGECVVCRGRFNLGRSHLVPAHANLAPLHGRPVYYRLSA